MKMSTIEVSDHEEVTDITCDIWGMFEDPMNPRWEQILKRFIEKYPDTFAFVSHLATWDNSGEEYYLVIRYENGTMSIGESYVDDYEDEDEDEDGDDDRMEYKYTDLVDGKWTRKRRKK